MKKTEGVIQIGKARQQSRRESVCRLGGHGGAAAADLQAFRGDDNGKAPAHAMGIGIEWSRTRTAMKQ